MRTKANYRKEIVNSTLTGLATLGMYIPIPRKMASTIYAMIYDAKENRTFYFNIDSRVDTFSPTTYEDLKEQFRYLFNGFFWRKEQRAEEY